jgi:hypothetical protein
MSHQTKHKRKGKKYQGPKNVRNSFGRTHAAFGPIIDWFERQLATGETIVNQRGEPCVVTSKNTVCPTWEAIEAMTDVGDMARTRGDFDVPTPDLDAFKRALKFDSLVPESTFRRAYDQLLKLRHAVFSLPAQTQVALAEATQQKQRDEMEAAA